MKKKIVYAHGPATVDERGFTLLELLVVIAIIGILASGLMLILNPVGQIRKANDARRKSDLSEMQKSLEQYYNDNGKYPTNTATYQITGAVWGSSWGNYMQQVPKDPKSPAKQYVYVTNAAQQTYWLYTSLDNTADIQLCNANGAVCANAAGLTGAPCGSGFICNYGVSSSNTSP